MPATIGIATPFQPYRIRGGGAISPPILRELEKSGQTFLQGTPVQLDLAGASGFIIANPAIVSAATAIIAGISHEPGSNLGTSGVAATQNLTNKVPNQTSAVITPIGAPLNDGNVGFYVANDFIEFRGLIGNGNDNTIATIAQADLGSVYGMTKDVTTGFWYIDKNKTTLANGACVLITELIDAVAKLNGAVAFRIIRAAQQLTV